jgi:hypothetical protein
MARRFAAIGLLAVFTLLVLTAPALATHARPKGASPTLFRLVPAHRNCQAPFAGSHNAPITGSSCVPVPENNYLTFNAPDRPAPFNTAVDGTGFVQFSAACGSVIGINFTSNGDTPPCGANAGDQEDLRIQTALTGVRCAQNNTQGLCNPTNPGCSGNCLTAGQLYQYRVRVFATLRLTDHDNTRTADPSCGSSCAGTLTDLSYSNQDVQCANGACNLTTSLEAQYPGGVREQKRHNVEIISFTVNDSFEFLPFLRMGAFLP